MTETLFPDLHRIKIPLEHSPLGSINSYLIRGSSRNLLVDTGLQRNSCRTVLLRALKDLEVNRSRTDIWLTHMHADHTGLIGDVATDRSTVYIGARDRPFLRLDERVRWQQIQAFFRRHGVPDSLLQALTRSREHEPGGPRAPEDLPLEPVNGGHRLRVGNYDLVAVHTPGHTPGHTCLYEPDRGLLFSGDHILREITPNISVWSEEETKALKPYLESLRSLRDLTVRRVLPGHRSPFNDAGARIDELIQHHEDRFNEILDILDGQTLTSYEVAASMEWDISEGTWEEFPSQQQMFATSEGIAHLEWLRSEGFLRRSDDDGFTYHRDEQSASRVSLPT